jgi:DNA-3-methyladenine glycosylase I
MSRIRCGWCQGSPLYENYHDQEWGVPIYEDQKLFEFLTLETFQAGLSWITVLKKRKAFQKAFDNFEYQKIARYDYQKQAELMGNTSIIRNRLKISAAINNAKAFLEIQKKYGSFSKYIWGFVNDKPLVNHFKELSDIPSYTPMAVSISKSLQQNGFKFVGPTIVYAHMQATGMVNDHLMDCFRHAEIIELKR